jgi:hypothetical protein
MQAFPAERKAWGTGRPRQSTTVRARSAGTRFSK